MFRLSCFALLTGSLSLLAADIPAGVDPATAQAKAALARLPLRFEANRGQLAPSVRYSAHSNGYDLYLTERGASLALSTGTTHPQRLDLSLLHSNRQPEIEALDRTATRTNFFRGDRSHWRADVASYSRVRYRAVYPGIDLVYYGNQRQLEYDFVLAPGADPNAIRLQFTGAAHVAISPTGDLLVDAGDARVVQKPAYIYQDDPVTHTRQQVSGRYTLTAHNTVGLVIGAYDPTRTLVVDPTLSYVSYLGGSGYDQMTAVKLGPAGLLYIAGQTDSDALPGLGYGTSVNGGPDAWIGILDTNNGMGLVWASYFGGTGIENPLDMAIDQYGAIYLTGTTTSTDFPVAGGPFESTTTSTFLKSFMVKLDPTQAGTDSLIFSSYLSGTTGDDVGNGIAVDNSGRMYVIGRTKSTDFPVTADTAYAPVLWGTQDMFLTVADPNTGALVYSTYLGGEDLDNGKSIAVGKDGLVYFAASTLSTQFPMAGYNYSVNPFGAQDIIVGVMDITKASTDSLVYCTYFGGSGNDDVYKLALDTNGNILITGYTLSDDFPVTRDAAQSTHAGNGDAYVAVLNPKNSFQSLVLYSTFLGGSHTDVAYGVAGDAAGNIYVTGYTLSPDFPVANAIQPGWATGIEIFLTKIKPNVAGLAGLQYSTYLGLSSIYIPTNLDVAPDGTVYLVGYGGRGLITTDNAFQSGGYAGGNDGFLMVVSQ